MSTSSDSRAGRRRRGGARRLLIAAWLLVLLVAGAAAGYLAVLAPKAGPEPQRQVRMQLPPAPEPEPREVAEPPATPAQDPAKDPAPAGTAPRQPESAAGEATDTAPPPIPGTGSSAEPDGAPPAPPQATAETAPAAEPSQAADTASGPDGAPGETQTATAPSVEVMEEQLQPAWQRFARRLTPPEGLPKIAVVVRGLGLSSAASEAAITRLPGAVSLSFSPYARQSAQAWAARARRQGHEVLIDLPMEPGDYPARDPGPQAMMTNLTAAQNLQRLDWILAQAEQEVGVVAELGSAFLNAPQAVEPVLQELKARGLMYLDNGAVPDGPALQVARKIDLPYAVNDRTLDGGQVSRPAIESRLVEAERIARQDGLAVVLARPFPVTIDVVEEWTRRLEERGFVLVPATYAAIRRGGAATANLR